MVNKILNTTLARRAFIENWERVEPILKDDEIALVKYVEDRSLIIGYGETPLRERGKDND